MDAITKMKNGCILCGGVGSGKSRTALGYYYIRNGGRLNCEYHFKMTAKPPKDLYIITTARKRDTHEWEDELIPFGMHTSKEGNYYKNTIVIDSWNNIKKYDKVKGAFFIFDEQRVVGSGAWVKAFLKIASNNEWILLSATPGDSWSDYIPVFIANGFYKNRSQFNNEHVVYSRFSKYPQIDHYVGTGVLIRQRRDILVNMDFKRETVRHHEDFYFEYNKELYREVGKTRFDPYKQEPIANAGGLCYVWRRISNSGQSTYDRPRVVYRLVERFRKVIVFYNFDYERQVLLDYLGKRADTNFTVAEWSGHNHENIPSTPYWVYLVQYASGCEGWNCTETNCMVLYSQNYSYKVMEQAYGRIDRLNTPYLDLYYYHFKTKSSIDMAISRCLKDKKDFNEKGFAK
uniref:Chromatin remodeling complex ATPase n=1 Tax=Siphoviridae sp. ctWWc42 TaxID=2826361 RepID=A0A8S5R292_9CAUD|nr:MAG TPA: Chromatin remodeling complex ATPase [Siphoviridae sp. ctWWc42]